MYTILGADGKEYGPVTTEQVMTWMSQGRASKDTKIKKAGEDAWRTIGEFQEFSGNLPPALPPSIATTAGNNVFEEYALSSPWARLGARFLDGFFSMFAIGPGAIMLAIGIASQASRHAQGPAVLAAIMPSIAVLGLGILAYAIIQIWLLSTRGQTVGKKVVGIRIARLNDGTNPGFVTSVLVRGFVPALIGSVIPFFSLVDACFIFRQDRRCIHDLMASTIVVDV